MGGNKQRWTLAESGPVWLVTELLPVCLSSVEGRARLLVVLGAALVAAISSSSQCPSQSHPLSLFPGPAWFRQLGTESRACSSGGELCGEGPPGVGVGWVIGALLEEPGHFHLPSPGSHLWPLSLLQHETPFGSTRASNREQHLVLSCP